MSQQPQPQFYQQTPNAQPGQYTPPPVYQPPKKKRSKTWIWIILALFIGLVLGYAVHTTPDSGTSPTTTTDTSTAQTAAPPTTHPTQAPTVAPTKWVTTHTFTGNGTKKTGFFTVADNWKLIWKCDPSSSFGGNYNVIVGVTGSDGSQVDPVAVNTICKAGNTGDSTDEHQGGQVYLDVNSEGSWTLQVQELK